LDGRRTIEYRCVLGKEVCMHARGTLVAATTLALFAGCYDAGLYGYDTHYVPLDAEEALHEHAVEAVFNDVRTDPNDFAGQLVGWFGAVEGLAEANDGATVVRLGFRAHQERHLCASEERGSCRVTVSQASSGSFSARLRLRAADASGQNRVAAGSLLRVYCRVTGEFDAEGGPLLECEDYRHWPRGQWAHTGMRGEMRR
jgi:hypothetical protein